MRGLDDAEIYIDDNHYYNTASRPRGEEEPAFAHIA
jgi:hypothetical protein